MQFNKAIFWDRDGVINIPIVRDHVLSSPRFMGEFTFMEGIAPVMQRAREKRFMNIVVTNQPDVARGKMSLSTANEMRDHCLNSLPLDEYIACYHDNHDQCMCRKPLPGMLNNAISKYGLNRCQSAIIGDRPTDILCGKSARVKTIYFCHGNTNPERVQSDYQIDKLSELDLIMEEI